MGAVDVHPVQTIGAGSEEDRFVLSLRMELANGTVYCSGADLPADGIICRGGCSALVCDFFLSSNCYFLVVCFVVFAFSVCEFVDSLLEHKRTPRLQAAVKIGRGLN